MADAPAEQQPPLTGPLENGGIDSAAADAASQPRPVVDAGGKGMLHFLQREELHDCIVRLDETKPDAKEFKCHRVVLSSSSRYFYERFITAEAPATAGSSVVLPALPEDEEVRRQVDIAAIFPLVLTYAYGGQRWEAIAAEVTTQNAMGLFVMAILLGIPSLAAETFDFIATTVLNASTATRLLYSAVTLGASGSAEDFQDVRDRCIEELQHGFNDASTNPEDLRLLCKLPIDVLAQILDSDELCVPSEGVVLQAVRSILDTRSGGVSDETLTILHMRLSDASEVMPQLSAQAATGAIWEAEIVQTGKKAVTSPKPFSPTAQGEIAVEEELKLLIPRLAPGSDAQVTLRCRAAGDTASGGDAGEILLGGSASLQQLLSAPSTDTGQSIQMMTPAGAPAGLLRFGCRREAAASQAEETKTEDQPLDVSLKPGEAMHLLGTVRFPHLSHEELITASRDPVLIAAGAQEQVLHALSAKLERHEHAQSAVLSGRPPRPSTQAVGFRAIGIGPTPGGSPTRRGQGILPNSPVRNGAPTMANLLVDTRAGQVRASTDQPILFDRRNGDFDEGGALYWLGTVGKTQTWRNPMSLGHVLALASGVGFGKLEDVVGRKAVNLRSANATGSFFGVDLRGERKLILQGYCLRNRDSTSHVLTSWIMQGSLDGQAWQTLEAREDRSSLRRAGATAYFQVLPDASDAASRPYRCFRVQQVGPNSSGSNNLVLSGLELYGWAVAGTWP